MNPDDSPQGNLTAEASAHRIEMSALRREVIDLKGRLEIAEGLSAAKLGVQPVAYHGEITGKAKPSVIQQYRALTGDARTAFYAANSDAIWAASEASL